MPYVKFETMSRTGRRVMRSPRYNWRTRQRPWVIQPVACAPVLPGETLKSSLMQSRVVSDPLFNQFTGWWLEYYMFYIKHRDLDGGDDLVQMVLDPEFSMAAWDDATDLEYYHTNGTDSPAINWPKRCLARVVDTYFRPDGMTSTTAAGLMAQGASNMPMAQIGMDGFWQSAINSTDIEAVTLDPDLAGAGSTYGTAVRPSEIDAALRAWEMQRLNKTTDMTYEDFIRSYGVKVPDAEEALKPELLRYWREWSMPTSTVEPSTGVANAAVAWGFQGRQDKDRFFKEPGFILVCSVLRPKVYLKTLTSGASMLMNDARSWLPAVMDEDPMSSLKKVSAGDPPLDSNTAAYYVDIRDLLLYGDQFQNVGVAATDANLVALPAAALGDSGKMFATATDADALFKNAGTGLKYIQQDGVLELHILGRQVDQTPLHMGNNTRAD